MALDTYRAKRDFRKTPEPSGDAAAAARGIFVIQKHAARRLHYDLRLELDGALKSWAVPKGPSLDPAEKRLAVHVEDHPIDYATFAGDIPAGEYGAGHVDIWDRGTWEPVGDPHAGYARGRLRFLLHGEKLRGKWGLTRMAGDGGKNWLLVKARDAEARDTGKGDVLVVRPEPLDPHPHAAELPARVAPQLATPADVPPDGDAWLHEVKWDGYRAIARVADGAARLTTRKGEDWTAKFAPIARAAAALPCRTALLDGEVVVLDARGRPEFGALQQALASGDGAKLSYAIFDLLHLNGEDLRDVPLERRKARLADLLRTQPEDGPLRYVEHVVGRGAAVLKEACGLGLEGIVSKRREGPYREGRRHPDWVKTRCERRQEVVVGGFTPPGGTSRTGLGALLIGVHDARGRLVYAGRVGTGFDERTLRALRARLAPLERRTSPFAPFKGAPRGTRWVEPQLVVEVRFTEWTRDGRMRHPIFVGVREDKPAAEVVQETAAPAPKAARAVRARRTDDAVEGVRLTNPDRVLWPEVGVTKRELAGYWDAVAAWALPQLGGRPLALVRCPRGHTGTCFFQKHVKVGLPPAVRGVRVDDEVHVRIDDAAGLVSLVQIDVIEIHPWGARADDVDRPDRIVVDLDPGDTVPWETIVSAAHAVRLRLERLGLQSWVKTTGGKGLHVVVPLARRQTWAEVKAFTHALARDLARRLPEHFVDVMGAANRKGRIFLDWMRNVRGATAIGAYSPRARPGAAVSTPLAWDELAPTLDPSALTVRTVPARLAGLAADPWAALPTCRQALTAALRAALR